MQLASGRFQGEARLADASRPQNGDDADVGIGDEFVTGFGDAVDVFGFDQESRVVVDDFFGAVDVEADNRFGAQHGLGQDAGEPLAEGTVDEYVGRMEDLGYLSGVHHAGESDAGPAAAQAQSRRFPGLYARLRGARDPATVQSG